MCVQENNFKTPIVELFISLLQFIFTIQNTAVRSIFKLKYDTPSNISRIGFLRYVWTRLSHSIPLVVRLVEEYNKVSNQDILNTQSIVFNYVNMCHILLYELKLGTEKQIKK
ncbi:hypothetical protein BpHYR1_010306 [Brachionus plicatilis]|uniref:Uncharacterized protein n=1 Tax=Brachionus plicatilis TaxID=10195 RepID=A0A3M7T850_BRAPC|nr:hypothetical protein BpHYR1_010306 [Brachionus plicatilis]